MIATLSFYEKNGAITYSVITEKHCIPQSSLLCLFLMADLLGHFCSNTFFDCRFGCLIICLFGIFFVGFVYIVFEGDKHEISRYIIQYDHDCYHW